MEPLNTKERSSAILKMALLFLFTLIVFVVAIYFDYQVPNKQLDMVKAERDKLKQEMLQIKEVMNGLKDFRTDFEQFSDDDETSRYYGRWEMARTSLDKILAVNEDEESVINAICNDIDWMGTRLTSNTQLLYRLKEKGAGSEELEGEIEQLRGTIRELESELRTCNIQVNSLTK